MLFAEPSGAEASLLVGKVRGSLAVQDSQSKAVAPTQRGDGSKSRALVVFHPAQSI